MRKNIMKMMAVAMSVITGVTMIPATDMNANAKSSRTITVDGDPADWSGIETQSSDNSNINKWAVVQNDEYVYFYVQENGGNEYGQPITSTNFDITYASGSKDGIRFAYNIGSVKNSNYSDIDGEKHAFKASDENGKYEVEFAIPQSFFSNGKYTLSYCGSKVSSTDIKELSELEEVTEEEPVYSGITVDGNFGDWAAVAKTDVSDSAISKVAMVFDGNYVYIYIKETSDGSATWSGEKSNGKFELLTDTGRRTVFKLNKDSVSLSNAEYMKQKMGDETVQIKHSNLQYEISVPTSALKQYKETISFGYALADEPMIADVSNIADKDDNKQDVTTFSGITLDDNYSYSDWDDYPQSIIEYSTSGGVTDDAEGALYVDGDTDTLYGHVKSFLHKNENEFEPFTVRFNTTDKTSISFRLISIDKNGKINWSPKLNNLSKGNYEFGLVWQGSWTTYKKISDDGFVLYGYIHITIGASSDEMEYKIDLNKLANNSKDTMGTEISVDELKTIQAKYIRIGNQWITYAGTSTGPVAGVAICCFTVVGVMAYKKRKIKVIK